MGHLSEEELIHWIRTGHGASPGFVFLGIGDDCAICRPDADEDLVITTDLLVEERHFTLATSRPEDIGWKVGAANLSDIAAMGASPAAFLLAAAFPPSRQGLFRQMMDGLDRILTRYETPLAGGDLSAAGLFFLCATVVGRVARGRALRRDGARPGDAIYITGQPGYAGAGLRLLQAGYRLDAGDQVVAPSAPVEAGEVAKACLLKHLRPVPRLSAGRMLCESGSVTAAIDTSDGLAKDLRQICLNSGVGARLDHYALLALTHGLTVTMDDLWGGGEDFELLFTLSVSAEKELTDNWYQRNDLPSLHRIGEICADHAGELRVIRNGIAEKPPRNGYDHFRFDA